MGADRFRSISSLLAAAVFAACGPSCKSREPRGCTSNDVQVVDLHSDFRDIWAGREVPETGKQAEPNVPVVVDFSTPIDPARVAAQFVPVMNDRKCGNAIAATAIGSASPSPSAVALRPAQALVSGCSYKFTIPSSPALTAGGKCLNKSLSVTFKVAGAHSTRLIRELTGVHSDGALKTVSAFQARPGINTPVSEIWSRYASVIGSPTLVAVGTPRPYPLVAGQIMTYYQQFHQGYPVADHGYQVYTEGGIFRDAHGRIAGNLPRTLPTPISQAAALQAALQYLKLQTPPWVTDPAKNSPPTMALALVSQAIDPVNADDFKLLWEVGLMGSGVPDPVGLEVDAASGQVVGTSPGTIRQAGRLGER